MGNLANTSRSESNHVMQALFLFISALGLLAALATVLMRNLVHAALFLVAFFFVVACQFVLLEAEFLAAVQVLVYVGAVAILLMFGIMLTRNIQGDDTTTVPKGWAIPAFSAALALFLLLLHGINGHQGTATRGTWSGLVRRPANAAAGAGARDVNAIDDMGSVVGRELLNRYAVPFETAGLLLTAALVGAVALAHRDPGVEEPRPGESSSKATRGGGPAGPGAAEDESGAKGSLATASHA